MLTAKIRLQSSTELLCYQPTRHTTEPLLSTNASPTSSSTVFRDDYAPKMELGDMTLQFVWKSLAQFPM